MVGRGGEEERRDECFVGPSELGFGANFNAWN